MTLITLDDLTEGSDKYTNKLSEIRNNPENVVIALFNSATKLNPYMSDVRIGENKPVRIVHIEKATHRLMSPVITFEIVGEEDKGLFKTWFLTGSLFVKLTQENLETLAEMRTVNNTIHQLQQQHDELFRKLETPKY